MGQWMFRIGAACLLEPEDRLVNAGLQQMHLPNPVIVLPYLWIAGTEADGSFLCRNCLLDRPGYEFAIPESRDRVYPIAVERKYRLIFGNGFCEPLLRA